MENRHDFFTEEGRVGWRLIQDVHLRQSGDKQVQLEPFQPERLRREVGEAVLGRLTEAQIADVVDGAIAQLRYDVVPKRAELLKDEEYNRVAEARRARDPDASIGPLSSIDDWLVRDAVEQQLREKEYRLAHVLYALSFRGRSHRKNAPTGWRTAEDVLKWLFGEDAYPDVQTDIPPRPDTALYEWQPRKPPTLPEFVVKRGAEININVTSATPLIVPPGSDDEDARAVEWPAHVRDRGVVRYLDKRFRHSVRQALLGRPDRKHLATYVSWWVLHDLQGQRRVDSSQLAIGVLDCLRRVDDIAYLRWVTQRKDFRAVREFRDEALGLIDYPSTRLRFSTAGPSYKHVALVSSETGDEGPLFRNLTSIADEARAVAATEESL
jgi:transcriptional regulator NrdR family protein